MAKPLNTKVILFNATAGLIVISAAFVGVRDKMFPNSAPPCSERYNQSVTFRHERSGVMLTAADLQSTSAGADHGVMDNFSIKPMQDGPSKTAMAVRLAAGSGQATRNDGKAGGISFPWKPRVLPAGTTSACLVYNIKIPANFEFDGSGSLPGLFGTNADDISEHSDRVDVRAEWTAKGQAVEYIRFSSAKETGIDRSAADYRSSLPRDKWLRIEQELVLNDLEKANGRVRLWMDGNMIADHKDLELRFVPKMFVEGVVVDVHYGAVGGEMPVAIKQDAELLISPLELRWK